MPRPLSHVRLALFAIAALPLAAAAAQQPLPSHATRAAAPANGLAMARAQVACVDDHGEEVAAAGRRWRATFTAGGVEFYPALGRSAPRALPLRLQLESIRRGGQVVLDAAAVPAIQHSDRKSLERTRGAIRERFESRAEGLEHSFVFAEPPAGSGDLVVRLRCESAAPAAEATDASLSFREPGLGGVSIGKVTGVDAAGRRVSGSLRRSGDRNGDVVEYVLPGDLFDRGQYPIVLDPLIGPIVDALPGADCDFPDVAYDAYSQSYCAVWTQFLGGGSTGVVGSVWDATTLAFGYAFLVNQSGNEDSIRVTSINGVGCYVLVWVNRAATGNRICGIGLEPTQAQGTSIALLYGPAAVDAPALSGEATLLDDDCLCVWDDSTYGVVGCTFQIEQDFSVTLGQPTVIGGGAAATEVAISKQGGEPGLHLVAWIDRPAGLPGWVRGQVVDHELIAQGPGVWIQNVALDARRPAIDGDGFLFLVAWEQLEAGSSTVTDVLGRAVTVGTTGVTTQGPTLDLAVYPGDVDASPDVALLGNKFGVAYQARAAASPLSDDIYFRSFARNGTPIGDELWLDLTTTTNYVYEHAPRLIGRRDGDSSTSADDGLVVFADQETVRGDSDVGLQAVEAMGPGGAVHDLGGGCGPGGIATVNGPFALGNVDLQIELYGVSPAAVPFLALAWPGTPFTCGPCTVLDPLSFLYTVNVAGTCRRALPLPGDPAYLGTVVEFQWVSFHAPYAGCPFVAGLVTSNRMQAQLDY